MKSGYHHVSIHEESQTFLGFQWPLGSSQKPRFFVFAVLPFGLSSAPYVFTKVFRPIVKHWRSRGVPLVLYLDDGAGCLQDFSVAQNTASAVRSNLANADVIANEQKSIWAPTQVLKWLGIVWDLSRGRIFISHRRIVKLLKALLSLKSGSRSHARLPLVQGKLFPSPQVMETLHSLCPDSSNLSSNFTVVGIALWILGPTNFSSNAFRKLTSGFLTAPDSTGGLSPHTRFP